MKAVITKIAKRIEDAGGRAFFVGGCVRDHLLNTGSYDFDIEVYGLNLEKLENILRAHGRVEAVGRSFGVLKLFHPDGEADFALPRRESKVGAGHRGFVVDLDPTITRKEACARRDFTINAMLMDILTDEIHDYHGGRRDLDRRILRHTGPAFAEDPLRAYRLMQFSARLEMTVAPETLVECSRMDLGSLARERIFAEFEKLFLLAKRPGLGLETARLAGIIAYHPELVTMVDCPQEPVWHPEGSVWEHTLLVVNEAAALRQGDRHKDLALMFGALCHDLGKPPTTKVQNGRIVSPGHADAGVKPTRSFMERLTNDMDLIMQIESHVRYHLRPADFYRVRNEIGDAAIRRLATQVNITDLLRVAQADHFGRTTPDALAREFPAGEWLLARAEELQVREEPPTPILMGRHLLQQGWQPGPEMGLKLEEAYEAQIEGTFNNLDEALKWLGLFDDR
ncbi:MAG: HD domain-containing protein [bacterium]|nr:HD domain-containing protein [bacterium]